MIKRYEHTQVGYVIIIAVMVVVVLIAVLMAREGFHPAPLVVMVILLALLVMFSSLTVIIWQDRIEVRFGPGLVRKVFKLADIVSSRIVKNQWYYGWGMRITSHGPLYNVSGLQAVEIIFANGTQFRIGTDVPLELQAALEKALSERVN
jgi:energy-coupling factor transporter transmembrane protein EcfT